MTKSVDFTDEQLLEILHCRDIEGWTTQKIADRFNVSRGTIIGQLHRIKAKADPKRIGEGTMPERWWKKRKGRT